MLSSIVGGIHRIKLKYPNSDISNLKFVGWGAGQFFRDYYPFLRDFIPEIEFTVCPRKENQGQIVHGVPVKAPDELSNEANSTVVIVFSAHYPMILSEIMGRFNHLRSILSFDFSDDNDHYLIELDEFFSAFPNQISAPQKKLPISGQIAIFVQGKIEQHTPLTLAWNKQHHPSIPIIYTTWKNQDKNLINACGQWCDEMFLVDEPHHSGIRGLNYTLRSCRHSLEYLKDCGISYAVRCRSDMIIYGSIFNAMRNIYSKIDNENKISIPLNHTFRHIPFFFGEKLMIGSTDNLLKLWSYPESSENIKYWAESENDTNLHFTKLREISTECFIWTRYAKSKNYDTGTIADSNNFARSNLVNIDPFLKFQSVKWLPLFTGKLDNKLCYDSAIWEALINSPEQYDANSTLIERSNAKISHLLAKKIWD